MYELEKRAIQIDMNNNTDKDTSLEADENTSNNDTDDNTHFDYDAEYSTSNTDDTARLNADEYASHKVSHMQKQEINSDKNHTENDNVQMHKILYGPTYVPHKEEGQKLLLPQTTDMSQKDNLKPLFNVQPHGMCSTEYDSLEQGTFDAETFSYSHEISRKHVLVQGVYVGSASPLIADIKTEPYSVIT